MSPTATSTSVFRSASGRVRAVIALGSVLGVGAIATLAAWSDSGDVQATFSTGVLDLTFDDGEDGNPTPYALTSLSLAGAAPGDEAYAPLEINNAGTVDFTYVMDTTVTPLADGDQTEADALAAELELTVVGVETAEDCGAAAFDAPAETVVAAGPLSGAAIATDRALTAGTSEVLCHRIIVGEDPPQDAGATATFGYTATQS